MKTKELTVKQTNSVRPGELGIREAADLPRSCLCYVMALSRYNLCVM